MQRFLNRFAIVIITLVFIPYLSAQSLQKEEVNADTVKTSVPLVSQSGEDKPVIVYTTHPRKYEIAGIRVTGTKNMEEFILVSYSGLNIGQIIAVPGDEITNAVKRYWRNGLFSEVSIEAEKIEGNKVWLEIKLKQRPRITRITYHNIKKSERQDLELKVSLVRGNQITPNTLDRAKTVIKKYYDDKGFHNAEVTIKETEDLSRENYVY
ncbi:MAG: POTRA domain-containing protein, partial [Bacteroidales bacterium]